MHTKLKITFLDGAKERFKVKENAKFSRRLRSIKRSNLHKIYGVEMQNVNCVDLRE